MRTLISAVKTTAKVGGVFWLMGLTPIGRRIRAALLNNNGIGG